MTEVLLTRETLFNLMDLPWASQLVTFRIIRNGLSRVKPGCRTCGGVKSLDSDQLSRDLFFVATSGPGFAQDAQVIKRQLGASVLIVPTGSGQLRF